MALTAQDIRYHHLMTTPAAPVRGPRSQNRCGFVLVGGRSSRMGSPADWNLIVACDMPEVTVELFEDLFPAAERSSADCVVPGQAGSLHPLCGVYHRRVAARTGQAIHRKSLKMHDFLSDLRTVIWPLADPAALANGNTPEQWSAR